ncbi:hypothetical protein MIMGU_mgv1a023800mg, partial [Erythranthe guttata]
DHKFHELLKKLEQQTSWDVVVFVKYQGFWCALYVFRQILSAQNLPMSILESECRIIYICRNPLDMFISYRHFSLENKFVKDANPLELDEAFDMFCTGIHIKGPFWDNVLGFWNAHLENPRKVLFLKYEDLKEDVGFNVKKIAEFLECPFTHCFNPNMRCCQKFSSLSECGFERPSYAVEC